MKKFIFIFAAIIAVIITFLTYSLFYGFYSGYSVGSRVGYISKISEKGFFIKSYEGYMRSSNLGTTSTTGENGFLFSVKNKETVEEIKKCIDGKIQIDYTQYIISPIEYSTDYIVYSIRCL